MNKTDLIKLTSNINKNSCPKHINFHCHTIFSDGSLNPEKLLEQAITNNLKFLSITDHHTVKAYEYIEKNNILQKYTNSKLQLITGIEINCLLKGCLVHVIGLGINIKSNELTPYKQGESAIGDNLNVKSVSNAIKAAGGLSFLAHPARYRLPFDLLIEEALNQGIDGIEVWYDYSMKNEWKASPFICDEINKLTDKLGMLKSCGTDSHGYSLVSR